MDTMAIVEAGTGVNLVPMGADKDTRHRLTRFTRWQAENGAPWHEPDLGRYRDQMLEDGLMPSSVSVHLSTIRSRYRRIVKDNVTRDALYAEAAKHAQSPADQKAFVDELLARLTNAVDPDASRVKVPTKQDRRDSDQLRLTAEQASQLLAAPGTDTLGGLRDTAILALLLCTGIREGELCGLQVQDLRQRLGGELALFIRKGKGAKQRLVPYGELSWSLVIVDSWLAKAGIDSGPVFRGFYKSSRRVRTRPLSVRNVQRIVGRYPVVIDGEPVTVRPHDCRRTFARRCYESGVDLVAVQQNLGHSDLKTTLSYVGTLDASKRRAPSLYAFDVTSLLRQGELRL